MNVPNCNFASDNSLDIPVLLPDLQADYIDQPVRAWSGKPSRYKNYGGLWHFYVSDVFFRKLWSAPDGPLETNAPTLCELNYSLDPNTPLWRVHQLTAQKRWLSRYWQSKGRRILVDVNVPGNHYETNFLGVPKGWRAYSTRGNDQNISNLEAQYEACCNHAGTTSLTFLVYSGGSKVRDFCRANGLEFAHNEMDVVRGRDK